MIRSNPSGDKPVIHNSSFIDPTAIVCGNVIIEKNVFVGPLCVIRSDEIGKTGKAETIIIKSGSNIQDGVCIHCLGGTGVEIGSNCSIAHKSIIHGPCTIGDDCFIGFNAVIFNAIIGAKSKILHNAVVEEADLPEKSLVPPLSLVSGFKDSRSDNQKINKDNKFNQEVLLANQYLREGYKVIKKL